MKTQTQNFKKGQWVIRKWKKEDGGEIDFTKFNRQDPEDSDEFYGTEYCRIKGSKIDTRFPEEDSVNYIDSRTDYDWRLATKAEIKKYTMLAATAKNNVA